MEKNVLSLTEQKKSYVGMARIRADEFNPLAPNSDDNMIKKQKHEHKTSLDNCRSYLGNQK